MNKSSSILSRHDQLVTMSFLKYKLGYTHAKIAELFNVSVMTVSRMLKTAIDEGIVTISVKIAIDVDEELSQQLKQKYALRDVLIVKNNQYEDAITTVSKAAASYLDMVILPRDVMGLAAGRVLSHVLPLMNLPSIDRNSDQFEVVQVQGGYPNLEVQNPTTTIVNFVNRFGIPGHLVLYPMYASSEDSAQMLYQQNKEDFENRWKKCTILLTGVGVFGQDNFQREESLLSNEDIKELETKGVMGVIFGRWFNSDGQYLDCSSNRKVMSITPNIQKKIPKRILVAFGDEKLTVINVLLKTQISNIFISDEKTAKGLLHM
ncbi:MAG: sugar-binding domain-containing protein [Sphaerochaetaceae bacterium]|nr:sugar-binding domain-containing protein [Sphaerochaetaceae bacterium]